ncbi:MAG: MATE family efflux transporter [Pirellula sp.]|jgi:MATE family multidrug resistance protein
MRTLRQDLREVISTAWPLMLSTGLFSITLFVDRMLLYKSSEGAAAAAMTAGVVSWAITCLPMGICGYTNTFVAQYLAAKRPDRAMQFVYQGLWLALAVLPILVLFAVFSRQFFLLVGHAETLATMESEYFRWLVPACASSILSAALVGLYAGSGRTRVLLISDVVATTLNVVLDYILIFGLFGFPKWGTAGAALASSIAISLKLAVLIYFAWPDLTRGVARSRQPATGRLDSIDQLIADLPTTSTMVDESTYQQPHREVRGSPVVQWKLMKQLIDYGWPAGVSVVAESWSFMIIMMIVGQLGEQAAAATTLALGVNIIAFIPLVGLGTAVGVLVGKYLVTEERDTARRIVFSGLLIGIAYSLIYVVLYGGFPDLAMTVYTYDVDPARFEEMRPILRPLLYFIAGYCIFDAFQIVYVGALKGAGDTYFVLGGHIVAGASTVIGALIVRYLTGWNSLYFWWGAITFWVVLLAIIFTGRYLQGGWQNKRVIDPTLMID